MSSGSSDSAARGCPARASYSLHVSLESDAIIAEGGATTATVTREGSTVGDLTVALSVPVNGSRVTVPATVTIPDGAASATFTITAVDDDVAGSVQTVIVAGRAAGYTSVTDSMDVTDDDVPTLTVSIAPGTISETDAPGTAVATVTRNTPLDRDLTVTVASMDPSEILFGQSSLGSGVIAEVEANNSLAAAQSIDGQWSLALDPDIGDSFTNTSTTIPHVTISGTGDGTFDYYAFTVPAAGVRGIFDIDYAPRGLPIRRVSTRRSSSIRRWGCC